jgi:hypothetical protein
MNVTGRILICVAAFFTFTGIKAQEQRYEIRYASFLGGLSNINVRGLGLDEKGHLYIGGRCLTPAGGNWDQSYKNGISSLDVFVSKTDPESGEEIYLRIIGGSSEDHLKAMSVDANGNVYLSGRSKSYDFPTTANAFHTQRMGTYDVIAAKLDPRGEVVYSSIFGARAMDECRGVGCNSKGYAVYVGGTHGNEYPTTPGDFSAYNGPEELDPGLLVYKQAMYHSEDCFVTMLSPDGSRMEFSHLFGGKGFEKGWAAAMDEEGNVYVTGYTTSTNLKTTSNAFSKSIHGVRDAFIVKFSAKGKILASTYFGGSDDDGAYGIALDEKGRIWVTGKTTSWDFPQVGSDYHKQHEGQDMFIACLSGDLSKLEFSTCFGGSNLEEPISEGLCITGNQQVVVVGKTYSKDFPLINNTQVISQTGEDSDVFCTVFNANTFACEWSTRFGGRKNDEPGAVVAGENDFWIAGATKSEDFPVSSDARLKQGKAFLVRCEK